MEIEPYKFKYAQIHLECFKTFLKLVFWKVVQSFFALSGIGESQISDFLSESHDLNCFMRSYFVIMNETVVFRTGAHRLLSTVDNNVYSVPILIL